MCVESITKVCEILGCWGCVMRFRAYYSCLGGLNGGERVSVVGLG